MWQTVQRYVLYIVNYDYKEIILGVDTVQTNLHLGLPGTKVERSGDVKNPTPRRHWSNATLKTDENTDFAEQFRIYGLEKHKNYLAFSIGASVMSFISVNINSNSLL